MRAWEFLGYTVVAAFLLQWVIARVCLALARRTATEVDDKILAAIRWPLFLTLLFVGVHYALPMFELDPKPIRFARATMITIGALAWMRGLKRVTDAICDMLARRVDDFAWIQPRSLPLYEILSGLIVVGAGVYVILLAWNVDLTAWLASAGIIGIAVGFAAKDTLANLFAGIFILADAPYKLGDFIVLGSGERGMVTDIGIRSTRLLTRDDLEVTIPNSVIANGKIVNETGGPHKKRRVRVTVGVAYGSDIDRVREVLLDVGTSSRYAAETPSPRVRFREFGDSALTFQLMVWINEPVLRGRALDELNGAVYKRLNEAGIEIPFPQRVVHLTGER